MYCILHIINCAHAQLYIEKKEYFYRVHKIVFSSIFYKFKEISTLLYKIDK